MRLNKPVGQAEWAGRKQCFLGNGQALAWIELGDRDAPPLLLIHGFTDSSRSWSLVAPHLSRFRLILPDLRGHGASGAPDHGYGPTVMAADLLGLMDHLGLVSAHLAGHSMGGMVAQALAGYAPERVRSMTLVATGAGGEQGPESWLWRSIDSQTFPLDPSGPFMREWFANLRPVDPVLVDYARREAAVMPSHVWRRVLRELALAAPGRLNALFKGPATILWGEADPLFSRDSQDTLLASLPMARFVALPGAGHNLPWELPELIAIAIAETATD